MLFLLALMSHQTANRVAALGHTDIHTKPLYASACWLRSIKLFSLYRTQPTSKVVGGVHLEIRVPHRGKSLFEMDDLSILDPDDGGSLNGDVALPNVCPNVTDATDSAAPSVDATITKGGAA